MIADDLDTLVGRTVRVRCAECRLVLGAIQSNGAAFGLLPVDSIERDERVVAGVGFHGRPALGHVGQRVHEHGAGLTTITWVHRCERRRRELSIQRRLDRLALAWVNAARAGDDLFVDP